MRSLALVPAHSCRTDVAATALSRQGGRVRHAQARVRVHRPPGPGFRRLLADVPLIRTIFSAGHNSAIAFLLCAEREALASARSIPNFLVLAQAASTASSPIALAGRASRAAAVALVAAAAHNVYDIPHRWTLLSACLRSTHSALDVMSSGKAVGRPGRRVGLSWVGGGALGLGATARLPFPKHALHAGHTFSIVGASAVLRVAMRPTVYYLVPLSSSTRRAGTDLGGP